MESSGGARKLMVALGVAASLLAGCTAGSTPDPDGAPAVATQVGSGAGSLRAVIVDEALRPLAGAVVVLEQTGHAATSDDAGQVLFTGLEPGLHTVVARRNGFLEARAAIAVEGDGRDAKAHVIVLAADSAAGAYVQVTSDDIFVDAAFIAGADGVTDAAVSAGGVAVLLPDGVPAWVQTEANWASTQPLGSALYLNYFVCPEGGTFCDAVDGTEGPSPVWVAANASTIVAKGYVQDGDLSAPLWAVYEGPAGAGLVFQQQVRMMSHRFYGFEPPTGWLFSRDGDVQPPA